MERRVGVGHRLPQGRHLEVLPVSAPVASADRESTVDGKGLPGNERRARSRQKSHHRGDLPRLTRPADGKSPGIAGGPCRNRKRSVP